MTLSAQIFSKIDEKNIFERKFVNLAQFIDILSRYFPPISPTTFETLNWRVHTIFIIFSLDWPYRVQIDQFFEFHWELFNVSFTKLIFMFSIQICSIHVFSHSNCFQIHIRSFSNHFHHFDWYCRINDQLVWNTPI